MPKQTNERNSLVLIQGTRDRRKKLESSIMFLNPLPRDDHESLGCTSDRGN